MGIQVLLEGQVAHKSHATDAAVELDSVEILGLGSFAKLSKGIRVGKGGEIALVGLGARGVLIVVCLWGRSSLVKNKIAKRQLLTFIERSERL